MQCAGLVMPGRLQNGVLEVQFNFGSVACLSEGLAALQLVGIGYNDDVVNGISLLSGFPQQLNASFRTLQRSSAFLRGFPQALVVFRKLQQSSAKYIGVCVCVCVCVSVCLCLSLSVCVLSLCLSVSVSA